MAKQPRITPITREAATDEQKRVGDFIYKKRGEEYGGPSATMLHAPGLTERFEWMREHILDAGLPPDLLQLATLVVARHWGVNYIWNIRADFAKKVGIPDAAIAAIRERKKPTFADPRHEAIYVYTSELMGPDGVSDAAHEAALKVLGSAVLVIELAGLAGLYTFLALQARAADLAAQPGTTPLPK